MANNTALITGASGGIGEELARIHAEKGGNLILVARSADKLQELAGELKKTQTIEVAVIVEDLTNIDSARRVYDQVRALGLEPDILINNAGFGGHGYFHERDLTKEQQMIQLNVLALTSLTHYFARDMVQRGCGKILNISSTASLVPGPLQAVYYATKAYVSSFSLALAEELSEFGVSVTALCPGPVNTGFVAAGDLEGVAAWKLATSPRSVAECGYDALQKGKLIAFNDKKLQFLLEWITPVLPRKMVLKMSRKLMEKNT